MNNRELYHILIYLVALAGLALLLNGQAELKLLSSWRLTHGAAKP